MTYSKEAIKNCAFKIHSRLDGNLSTESLQGLYMKFYDGDNGELGDFIDEVQAYLDEKLFGMTLLASGWGKDK